MDYLSKITSLQQKSVVSQERTFKKWINEKLKNRRPVLEVVNLFEDLKDGKILLALLEVLSHKILPSEPISGVVTRIHSMNNVDKVFQHLSAQPNIKLYGTTIEGVLDGKPSQILGVIWKIIQGSL